MDNEKRSSLLELLIVFFRLGLTSFGGPVAHLGYFRDEFVTRRKWLSDEAYADLIALCQFLPGPASSQTGFAVGVIRRGLPGGIVAFVGFTLPSAALLFAAAMGAQYLTTPLGIAIVHGLKLVAVAVVAQAVWGMARVLCPDRTTALIAFASLAIVLLSASSLMQVAVIAIAALVGLVACRIADNRDAGHAELYKGSTTAGAIALFLFFAGLIALPFFANQTQDPLLELADIFYRAGALVFGGGHVVLPLLESRIVEPGFLSADAFLTGYGAAQAVPGPLFSVAAYLGALMPQQGHPTLGAVIALAGIFVPGFLLVYGALPFWHALRTSTFAKAALRGVNAAVVGLLAAALYDPIWTATILTKADFVIASGAFLLLTVAKAPSLAIVIATTFGTAAAQMLGLI